MTVVGQLEERRIRGIRSDSKMAASFYISDRVRWFGAQAKDPLPRAFASSVSPFLAQWAH